MISFVGPLTMTRVLLLNVTDRLTGRGRVLTGVGLFRAMWQLFGWGCVPLLAMGFSGFVMVFRVTSCARCECDSVVFVGVMVVSVPLSWLRLALLVEFLGTARTRLGTVWDDNDIVVVVKALESVSPCCAAAGSVSVTGSGTVVTVVTSRSCSL